MGWAQFRIGSTVFLRDMNADGRQPTAAPPASARPAQGPPVVSADVAALRREIEWSRGEIFTLRRRLKQRERQLEDMFASTSWRITAPMRNIGNWVKTRRLLKRGGPNRQGPAFSIDPDEYEQWVRTYSTIDAPLRTRLTAQVAELPMRPLISVIMPSYNIEPRWMSEAIASVRRQIYPYWELCIADDASTLPGVRELITQEAAADARIRVTFRATNGHISASSNSALDLATGDYVALVDADDRLPADALFCVAREIASRPDVDLIFSDEDKIDADGRRFDPLFKAAWNPALMLSQNAFCHLGVFRRALVEKVGRFREGYEGAQDHDLVLRCAEATTPERIRHIPRVLYHWRVLPNSTATDLESKPYAAIAGGVVVEDHLRRQGIKGRVEPVFGSFYQVIYEAPDPAPLVSIIVPTTLRDQVTARCVRSVLGSTRYADFELLLVATEPDLAAARADGAMAPLLADSRVRTVEHASLPFNYSEVNNRGAAEARGQLLCFLNDDVAVINSDWLTQLVARVCLDGVGAAGPLLYYPSDLVQHAGVLLGVGDVADHAFRGMRRGQLGYFGRGTLEQDYTCLTAACLLLRRDLFEAVGGFDAMLPAAFNDVDLCIKIRRTGARIVWTPTARMYHHESLTFGPHNEPGRAEQFERDVAIIRDRWVDVIDNDPVYNPNLSLDRDRQFELAARPRTLTTSNDGKPGSARTAIARTGMLA